MKQLTVGLRNTYPANCLSAVEGSQCVFPALFQSGDCSYIQGGLWPKAERKPLETLGLGRQRHMRICEFEESQGYIVRLCLIQVPLSNEKNCIQYPPYNISGVFIIFHTMLLKTQHVLVFQKLSLEKERSKKTSLNQKLCDRLFLGRQKHIHSTLLTLDRELKTDQSTNIIKE